MTEEKNEKEYFKLNKFSSRKMGDMTLITLDHGSWFVLGNQEFRHLQRMKMDPERMKYYEDQGLLLTKKGIRKIEEKYKRRYHFLGKQPGLHIIIPTLSCNMQCNYCHSGSKDKSEDKYHMSEETATKTVDFILNTKNNNIIIEFQGGEPLLNFGIVKHVVEYSKKKNAEKEKELQKKITCILVTNLTLLADEHIEFIHKHNIKITTSMDGPERIHDSYRKFRPGAGSYKKVVEGFDRLKKKGILAGMLMTTTKESLRYPEEIVDEYVNHGMTIIQIKPMNWIGDGYANERYTAEEFTDFWKKALNHIIWLNKKGINIKERTTDILLRKILTEYDPNFMDIRSPCGAVTGQLLYNHDGNIYCCDDGKIFDIFRVGSVHGETYEQILNKNSVKALISSSINGQYLCDACAYKPYCGTCPVANYAEGGTVIPKLYKSFRCKIRKIQFDHIFEMLIFDKEKAEILKNWVSQN